jgi:plasmid stabilization system protein ParE
MIELLVDEAARDDIVEAAVWYEQQRVGLGDAFVDHVERAFFALRDHEPFVTAPLLRSHGVVVRRVFVRRFPYRVIFIDGDDSRRVIAVLRHGRADRRWRQRL